MNYSDAHKRLLAVQALLLEPSTTREKFSSIRALLKGVHPDIDRALDACEREISTIEKFMQGAVIELMGERLPESTEEEKKRKKALLFFINTWNSLKGEVTRVQGELQASNNAQNSADKASYWGRIFNFAKGPFGIITVAAVGLVILLQTTSVSLTIRNDGCGTMQTSASIPVSLPGISLPSEPIESGGSAVARIPPLTFTVDGTVPGLVTLKALTFSATFQLPNNITGVTLDRVSLMHKKQDIHLSESKEHTLTLSCVR